jgi:5-methylcytosine-specific restriction endonuclease McrA
LGLTETFGLEKHRSSRDRSRGTSPSNSQNMPNSDPLSPPTQCSECSKPRPEHIIARRHGGMHDPANLTLACPECNYQKGTNFITYPFT